MRSRLASAVSLMLLSGFSCTGGEDPAARPASAVSVDAQPEESTPPVADIPEELVGLFKTVVTLEDLKRLGDPHYDHHPEELTGRQYLEIRSDGTYAFFEDRPERPIIRGSVEANGSQLTLSGEVAAIAGFIPCPGSGTYTWQRAGDKLTFANVDDRCLKIGRIAIMTSSPFREV